MRMCNFKAKFKNKHFLKPTYKKLHNVKLVLCKLKMNTFLFNSNTIRFFIVSLVLNGYNFVRNIKSQLKN